MILSKLMIKRLIWITAIIELSIGALTIYGLMVHASFVTPKKPLNIFIFVSLAAIASIVIGIGLLTNKQWARNFLVFFSGYIILTKIMIFVGLLHLRGEIAILPPASLKNYISIVYHGLIILFLTRQTTKEYFAKNEPEA